MRRLLALTLVLLAAPDARATVEVQVSGDRVDVQATNAPLSEILDGLARQLRIKIVYEGPPPKQLLSVDLKGRTPAEAFLAIVEGQGLGYALSMDKTGTRVETVLMSALTTSSSSSGSSAKGAGPRPVPPPDRRARESVVEEPLDVEGVEGEELPPDTGRPDMIKPVPAPTQPKGAGAAETPTATPAPGVFIPAPPSADYPTSVFAPKPPAPDPAKPKPESTPPPFNP